MVPLERVLRKIFGAIKSFQIHIVLKITDVEVIGFISGNTILKNTIGMLQPSTIAAS